MREIVLDERYPDREEVTMSNDDAADVVCSVVRSDVLAFKHTLDILGISEFVWTSVSVAEITTPVSPVSD